MKKLRLPGETKPSAVFIHVLFSLFNFPAFVNNKSKKCLYDVIKEVKKENPKAPTIDNRYSFIQIEKDDKVRPNQLFSLSLSYPVIDCKTEIARNILITTTQKLLNKYGLRTLAKGEPGYIGVYEGGPAKRDSSYHQGPTWPWLFGLYYNAMKISKEVNP